MNISIRKAQNSVDVGIARFQSLLYNEAIVFDSSMEKVFNELELYSYDPKSIEKGEEKPIKDNDHHMDGIRYLIMEQYGLMKQMIRTLGD